MAFEDNRLLQNHLADFSHSAIFFVYLKGPNDKQEFPNTVKTTINF
jgi:hypothetical protein